MIVKLECSEREAQALAVLIDAAVKALGIRGAGDAVYWIQKLDAAVKEAQQEQPAEAA